MTVAAAAPVTPQSEDEKGVQHQIQHRGHAQEIQRRPGISHGPEDGGDAVVQKLEHQSQGIHREICDGQGDQFLPPDVHQTRHKPAGAGQTDEHGGQAHPAQEHQRGGHSTFQLVPASGAVKLGDHDAAAVAEAQGKGQKQECQRGAGAHGGQRRLAHIVAHHDAVHRVVQLLEELPGHDGQGKEEQLPPGRAGGHIIFFGKRRFRHGKASFPEKQTRRRQIGMSRQAVFDLEYLFYSTDAVQLC